MKSSNRLLFFSLLFSIAILLNSCEVITGVFKAGVWVGVIIVVAVIAVIIYLFTRSGRSGK